MQLALPLTISAKREKRSASTWDLIGAGSVGIADAGVPVSPYLAENLSAVFCAVQTISETVGTLPLIVYRKQGDGVRQVDSLHPVARLFSGEPNQLQTATEFLEMMTANCLLRGNGYAEIRRDQAGQPIELIPLHPDMVSVLRIPRSQRIVFDVTDWEGGATRRLLQEEMLHLKDRSDDGVCGKSRLARARETFGTAIATEHFAASTYRNGAALSGVISHPETLGPEAAKTLRDSLAELYGGSGKAGKIGVLEEGMSWQALSVSPKDAEMLASRQFSIQQIARMFRLPPPLLGDLSGGNFSSLVELGRWFASHCIAPWCTRWEKAIERALFSEAQRPVHEVEFDLDDIMRADMLSRFQSYRIAREIGLYSANELRKFEKQNPRTDAGGDDYLAPLNMSPEQAGTPKPA